MYAFNNTSDMRLVISNHGIHHHPWRLSIPHIISSIPSIYSSGPSPRLSASLLNQWSPSIYTDCLPHSSPWHVPSSTLLCSQQPYMINASYILTSVLFGFISVKWWKYGQDLVRGDGGYCGDLLWRRQWWSAITSTSTFFVDFFVMIGGSGLIARIFVYFLLYFIINLVILAS